MRYLLHIDLSGNTANAFSFKNTELSKVLTKESLHQPAPNINLSVLTYERTTPGLVEKNWEQPFYTTEEYFLFIGGFILNRNKYIAEKGVAPTPKDVAEIFLNDKDNFHNYFKGCFYVVFYNKKTHAIELISSPMFMYPAFYSLNKSSFIFTNHIGGFFNYFKPELDEQGLVEFSLFDHCIHTRTLYKGIFAMQGGQHIIIDKDSISERTLYDVNHWYTTTPLRKKQALPLINETLKNAIKNYTSSTDTFNIALTGGFDGRLNFSYIHPNDYNRLQSYSYGMPQSNQISIPSTISSSLKFKYTPIFLDENFEKKYASLGYQTIHLTSGITGFNRAVYPYAYGKISEFSRSCIIGQCDMIRPLFNNPAGVILNNFSHSIFFKTIDEFKKYVLEFIPNAFIDSKYFTDELIEKIYKEIHNRYVNKYPEMSASLQYFFFYQKESIMKYWHTEFHVVNLFIDDYVSFADLDYLEAIFASEYAGIYKGLFADSQLKRKNPHDLYVDLMSLNNNKLNYFYNDRGFKPGWLKFGKLGWMICGVSKKLLRMRQKGNDTFNPKKWARLFQQEYMEEIKMNSTVFNTKNIANHIASGITSGDMDYRFNRAISLKIWMQHLGIK